MRPSCDVDLIKVCQQCCGRPCQNPVTITQELTHLGTSRNNYDSEEMNHQLSLQQLPITWKWEGGAERCGYSKPVCGNFYYSGINIHLSFLTSFQLQSIGFQVYKLFYCLKAVCYHFLLGLGIGGGKGGVSRGREDFPLLHIN